MYIWILCSVTVQSVDNDKATAIDFIHGAICDWLETIFNWLQEWIPWWFMKIPLLDMQMRLRMYANSWLYTRKSHTKMCYVSQHVSSLNTLMRLPYSTRNIWKNDFILLLHGVSEWHYCCNWFFIQLPQVTFKSKVIFWKYICTCG